ncbi:MAG: 3-keto-disaccharide hydrolase [Vicinamibacteraceae bacterium]
MNRWLSVSSVSCLVLMAAGVLVAAQQGYEPTPGEMPPPAEAAPVVTPGDSAAPPSDAIVLFDGKDLSHWVSEKGQGAAGWKVENGYMEVVKGAGGIATKQRFGDSQLHIEWAAPAEVEGESQERGNSGVFLQGVYEVQVLDAYQNETYFHGTAGSVYKQHAPLVNAARKPGEWQTYDIIFRAPTFDSSGAVTAPAYVTVLWNGVLVQDHVEVKGTTTHQGAPKYEAHGAELPLLLQDHGNPVRFRNIWIRKL